MNIVTAEQCRTVNVLLVDDDDGDAKSVQRAFRSARIANPIVRAIDGIDALNILRGTDGKTKLAPPYLLLVDLNMPRMNGIEFLRVVKADAALCSIPVIVLTTSREESDRVETFQLSVAGYMIKPADYRQFVEVVRTIDLYWTLSELPD